MEVSEKLSKMETQLEGQEGLSGMIDAFQETVSQVSKISVHKAQQKEQL